MEMCLKEHTAIRSIFKSSRMQHYKYKVLHQYDGEIPVAYLWKIQPIHYLIQVTKRKEKQKERKGQTYVPSVASILLNNIISMLPTWPIQE